MFQWWKVLPDNERQQWTLDPLIRVGPLRFGMTPDQVSDALSEVTALPQQFQIQNGVIRVKGQHRELGLTLYYDEEERLKGVVVDALCGPQVHVEGIAVVGRTPSVLEQWMLDRAEQREPHEELTYMDAGMPGSETLGVVISVQRAGDQLLTRPVFFPAHAMDVGSHFLPEEVWMIN